MRRIIVLAGVALTLVLAVRVGLLLTDDEDTSLDAVPSGTPASELGNPRATTSSGSRSASTAVAPSPGEVTTAPGRVDRRRDARAARAAFVAAKIKQGKGSQRSLPTASSAQEHLPPEEVAAMEAAGMDWRSLEKMMRDGVPGEPPPVEAQPLRLEATDDDE